MASAQSPIDRSSVLFESSSSTISTVEMVTEMMVPRETQVGSSGQRPQSGHVSDVADALADFIDARYSAANWGNIPQMQAGLPPQPWPPPLGVVVGGYSPHEFFPEVYEIVFPGKRVGLKHPPSNMPRSTSSMTFWGQTAALARLVAGANVAELRCEFTTLCEAGKRHLASTFRRSGKYHHLKRCSPSCR